MCESSLGRPHKVESIAFAQKFSVPLIQEEQRAAAANHQEVLKPLIFEIREQSASRAVQHAHSGLFSHIFECPITAIAIEPVGKSRRLADIHVIQSIVVEISRRQAIVAVNVDPARPVENRAPIIDSVKQLILVRFRLA